MGTPLEGLRQARMLAQMHMRDRLDQGAMWDERTVTQLLLAEAYTKAQIRYAEFTPRDETDTGADWIWWFIDRTDECFGLLMQAKSLKRYGEHFRVDFGYRKSHQITRLLNSADALGIPAVYALYCGDPLYRRALCEQACPQPVPCHHCAEKSVSVVTAHVAHYSMSFGPANSAEYAYQNSLALESLAQAPSEWFALRFGSTAVVDPNLKQFLKRPQSGARAIAKSVLHQILQVRSTHFAAASTESTFDLREDMIFHELSDDRGHFSTPYMPHVLRGLRRRPPSYVTDFIDFDTFPDSLARIAAGIVVIFI